MCPDAAFHWPCVSVPTGRGHFLRFWEYGACVSCPSGEAGQECLCWTAALLPQCRMPEPNEVWKTHIAIALQNPYFDETQQLQLVYVCPCCRQRACVSAVENAQQKATEVSQLLGQTLGSPLLVREEETREWRNEDEEEGGRGQGGAPLSPLPSTPTITASSRVSVSFSLRDRSRKKLWRCLSLTHETKERIVTV